MPMVAYQYLWSSNPVCSPLVVQAPSLGDILLSANPHQRTSCVFVLRLVLIWLGPPFYTSGLTRMVGSQVTSCDRTLMRE